MVTKCVIGNLSKKVKVRFYLIYTLTNPRVTPLTSYSLPVWCRDKRA